MHLRYGLGIVVASLALAAGTGGCSGAGSGSGHGTGSIELPLLGTSRSGETYRLTATFHIDGPVMRELHGHGDVVEAELPIGSYTVRLDDGWTLGRVLPDGGLEPVAAALTSPNPMPFAITDGATTVVAFMFKVGGVPIGMGKGDLIIVIDVNDGLVDDFEDGDGAVLRIGGRNGFWFTFNDGTGAQVPAPGQPVAPELIGDGRGYVLHTDGAGFFGWGAGVGASLKVDDGGVTRPYDASGFVGIRFKYRSSREARFEIDTTATVPPPSGTCAGSCFDSHGVPLPPSATWRTFEVVWGELGQRGFGSPVAFSPSQSQVIKWVFAPDSFDFSVDDVELMTDVVPVGVGGAWSPVITFPSIPIHAHLLPTGDMMFWDVGHGAPGLFDPLAGTFAAAASPDLEIFCSGHSFLADGRLMVTGGQDHGTNEVGLTTAFAYDPGANTWTQLSDMNAGRWYPTNVTLGDGSVLVASGSITPGVNNQVPQVYTPATDSWRSLSGATRFWGLYPRMHLAPNGTVFHSGPEPATFFVNVSGDGSFIAGPARSGFYGDYGNSVMYAEGKIVAIGGGDPPRADVQVIDLAAPTPAWRTVAPMSRPRRQHNAVILADGKVLVTGGTAAPGFNNFGGAVREAELWDPDTETWQLLAPQVVARLYHSVGVLLPDGRVLSGGGGHPPGENGGTDNFSAEIFSPPYLFQGLRPVILAAPGQATWGESIVVQTPDANRVGRVNLIRLTSVTHSTNMDQRLSRPSFASAGGELHVHIPTSPNIVPPGPYLLFLVDGGGVPSEGHMIVIGAGG
jgi:hypothetical protein